MEAAAHGHSTLGIPKSVGQEYVAADAVAVEPSEAQIRAGNYAKHHISFQGLKIAIENRKGSERRGLDPLGAPWSVTMPADYGYIKRTIGADNDQLDCYVGPDWESQDVWIIDQVQAGSTAFDEHKVMLGFGSKGEALTTYRASFSDGKGADRIGNVRHCTMVEFKVDLAEAGGKEFLRADDQNSATTALTDHEVAEGIRDGNIQSPTKYGDFWLFDLRITGTGVAYRDSIDEWAIRDPQQWLSPEFIQRCNGLTVTFGHPESSGLNHEEFQSRAIGSIVLPYVKGDEVWGVAKIFDADVATLMQTTHRSTSPGVTPPQGSQATQLKDGTKVLAEDLPLVLDHLAVCEIGVWDKDGPPDGIRLDALSRKDELVALKDSDLEGMDKARRDSMRAKFDEMDLLDAKKDAKKDGESETEVEKKDSEETDKEAIAAAEREKSDKKDAKKDGEKEDIERAEKAGEEEKEAERAAASESKKDAAPKENADAEVPLLKDSAKRIQSLESEIATMRTRMEGFTKQPSLDERNALAAAYHRADQLYQMLGDQTPQPLPGESPIAYRRRAAAPLRKYGESFKTYTIHDSLDLQAFELVENKIYEEAMTFAKNPTNGNSAGKLRPVTTTELGRQVTRYYGDSRAAWLPFMPANKTFITKFNRPQSPGR